MALQKAIGGRALKIQFLFSGVLAAKNVWRLIKGTNLWV